jgi:hypothetical protein
MIKRVIVKWIVASMILVILMVAGYIAYISRPAPSYEDAKRMIENDVQLGSSFEAVESFLKWRRIRYVVYTNIQATGALAEQLHEQTDHVGTLPRREDLSSVVHIPRYDDGTSNLRLDCVYELYFNRSNRLVARYGPITRNGLINIRH